MLHGSLVVGQQLTGTALRVRHEQGPSLPDAVRPHRDVAALEAAGRLVGRVLRLLCQLALAAHALLAVLPRVVEVAQIDGNAEDSAYGKAKRCLQPAGKSLLANGIDKECQGHQSDDEQEIVAHLDMVAVHLHRREKACHHNAEQISAAIAKHHAANGRRNETQGQEFPDVTGSNT